NQYIVLNSATMNNSIVGYRNIMTNNRLCLLVGTMNHSAILYVGVITYRNGVNITTYHSIKPYRTVVSHHDLTNHHGGISQKTILPKPGSVSPHLFNDCHISVDI